MKIYEKLEKIIELKKDVCDDLKAEMFTEKYCNAELENLIHIWADVNNQIEENELMVQLIQDKDSIVILP